jgi:hypothetical protein
VSKKQVAALKAIVFTLQVENSQLRAELARVLRMLPPVPPRGWLTPKQVAYELGVSLPRITQMVADGRRLWSVNVGHNVWIDPASPALKERDGFKQSTRGSVRP